MMTEEYVFNNKEDIVSYVYHSLSNPTPIKLQKTLYFLWAFYSATYGNIVYDKNSEFDSDARYPKNLFKPEFEAWRYGPVDNQVYSWDKGNVIETFRNNFQNKFDKNNRSDNSQDMEIKLFMDDLIKQIDLVNDFGLVDRSHEDKAYKAAYKEGAYHVPMNPEAIKEDYLGYVKHQAEI